MVGRIRFARNKAIATTMDMLSARPHHQKYGLSASFCTDPSVKKLPNNVQCIRLDFVFHFNDVPLKWTTKSEMKLYFFNSKFISTIIQQQQSPCLLWTYLPSSIQILSDPFYSLMVKISDTLYTTLFQNWSTVVMTTKFCATYWYKHREISKVPPTETLQTCTTNNP